MSKLVMYGKEVKEGDQIVVYKRAEKRLADPVVVTVQAIKGTFFTTNYQFDRSIFSNIIERDISDHVFRPLVRKGDKLHVFKFNSEEIPAGDVVTALEDETVDEPVIVVDPPVECGVSDNLIDLRDTMKMDEWYFYTEEAEDYPTEWYEDPAKEERTSWVANEGGEEASVAIDIAGNISDSYNDCETSDVVFYTPSDDDDEEEYSLEEEYTPMSYADFNAAHGGGKTLKDYTGVDITEDSLAFESAVDKTLKEITPESLAFEESVKDSVNHPDHYTHGDIETIEMIKEITKGYDDGFVAYCVGNSVKYESRAPFKHDNPKEDIDKAIKYLSFASNYLAEVDE